jgi:hypothetical protein
MRRLRRPRTGTPPGTASPWGPRLSVGGRRPSRHAAAIVVQNGSRPERPPERAGSASPLMASSCARHCAETLRKPKAAIVPMVGDGRVDRRATPGVSTVVCSHARFGSPTVARRSTRPPPREGRSAIAPYRTEGFLRGNLHTHTDRSDGDSPPRRHRWYRQHGYAFVALTGMAYRNVPTLPMVMLGPNTNAHGFSVTVVDFPAASRSCPVRSPTL